MRAQQWFHAFFKFLRLPAKTTAATVAVPVNASQVIVTTILVAKTVKNAAPKILIAARRFLVIQAYIIVLRKK